MWQWKSFENRPVFDEVMCRLRRLTFLAHPVYSMLYLWPGFARKYQWYNVMLYMYDDTFKWKYRDISCNENIMVYISWYFQNIMIFSCENLMMCINQNIKLLFICYSVTFVLYFTLRITGNPSQTIVYCDSPRNSAKLTGQCGSYAFTGSPLRFYARHILRTSNIT